MKKASQLFLFLFLFNSLLSQQLKHYTCFIDRIDIHQWLKNGKRTFDENGIILNKGKYHPLGIVHYGLLNYYEFLRTNDSVYYTEFNNQIAYFKDSTKVNILQDGKGIGLPYNYKYANLKPPWYSGMTQGYALSFLLRYRSISNDENITPIIKKIAYQMLLPLDKNGTIGKTPEGYTWIEEYPNSKKSPQVLNGFINGLIGLKEYLDFFPTDTLARRIHDECYESLKLTLSKYDQNNWSNYNRKNSRCTVMYLRYEIMEMKHLLELYGDSTFLDQMKIWSSYADEKPLKTKRTDLKLRGYFPAKKAIFSNDTKIYKTKYKIDTLSYWNNNIGENCNLKYKKNRKRKTILNISADSIKNIKYIILKSGENKNMNLRNISLKNKNEKWEKISVQTLNNTIYIKLNKAIKNEDINLKLKHNSSFNLSEITLTEIKKYEMPFFYYYKTKTQLPEGKYEFKINHKENIDDITIFYKSAKQDNLLKQFKWIATNCIKGQKGVFEVTDNKKYYEFMVIYQPTQIQSEIGTVKFSKID